MPQDSFVPLQTPIEARLQKTAYNAQACLSALRGNSLPSNLGNDVVRLCVLSGIRHHASFASSPDVTELCHMDGQEIFARARNARLIMSGRIPSAEQMYKEEVFPYCIWHPKVASEDTYRQLSAKFPDLRYQVGRACAVGGYDQLYEELGLDPDVSIAEEARESRDSAGARRIFDRVMAMPTRYAIMSDYARTVSLQGARAGACLNADTGVKATLAARRKYREQFVPWQSLNITEDWGIAETNVFAEPSALNNEEVALFASPLPGDLPTIHKDLLILVAAYTGNVDRYARLRRPYRIRREFACLVPGVYHSTAMACWLDRNPDVVVSLKLHPSEFKTLRRAINARLVMNNSFQHLLNKAVPDDELPYWVWYPTAASSYTLAHLAEARPSMRPQCARACIAAGYRGAYQKIMDMRDSNDKPLAIDVFMAMEARSCPEHDYFEPDVAKRQAEQGLDFLPMKAHEDWKRAIPWLEGDRSSSELRGTLLDGGITVHSGQDGGIYEDLGLEMGPFFLYISSPAEEIAHAKEVPGGVLFCEDHTLQ